jgi:ubiquinone/menaquinone biosynthesis C-methylase UbiE
MSYDSKRYALLNRWDPRHLDTVERLLGPKPGERVLEVGCGRGHLNKRLREMGVDAVGIDANPQAAEHAVSDGVITMDAAHLRFEEDSFDKIVSVHAIEHIPPIEEAFAEMARVLKPGGTALFVYPAEPIKGIWAIPTAVVLHNNPLKATQVHCNWLWPARVRELAEMVGLVELHSEFNLLSSPQFVSLFRLDAAE